MSFLYIFSHFLCFELQLKGLIFFYQNYSQEIYPSNYQQEGVEMIQLFWQSSLRNA